MSTKLEHNGLSLQLSPDTGQVTLRLGPIHLRGKCSAEFSRPGERRIQLSGGHPTSIEQGTITRVHGSGSQLSAQFTSDAAGLALHLETAIYDRQPFVALRVGLTNASSGPVHVHTLTPLTTSALDFGSGPLDGWVNGFHSWSFTGFVPHDERQPHPITGLFTWPMALNPLTPRPRHRGQYAAEMVGALVEAGQQALVAGFIGLEDQFGQVYLDGRPGHRALTLQNTADGVPLPPGETLWGEWAVVYRIDLPHPDPLGVYADAVTRLTPPRIPESTPGWSSWYQFFDDVTAADMQRNQAALAALGDRLPLRLVQLDDGYQPHWGDWLLHNEKFPGGVPGWADGVRAGGFEPGLWLSPFTVERGSEVWEAHPEAVLRGRNGRPANGGITPARRLYGLDPTHPATQGYVREVIDTIVHRWGIRYLKLDFLYCAALPGQRHDPARTRAQALRDGLKLIRKAAGQDAVLLGCGCPLGPAVGVVDIMRVSADVAPTWYPELFGVQWFLRRDFNIPAARNSTVISLSRAWTHRRFWWLDADNLLVREQQDLTAAEVQTLATTLAMTGSHLMLSDDLPELSAERQRWAANLLPLFDGDLATPTLFDTQQQPAVVKHVHGAAGDHSAVALFNWVDEPAQLHVDRHALNLSPGIPLLVFDYWGRQVSVQQAHSWDTRIVDPHGVVLLGIRPVANGPQLVGTDFHISMGAEITRWQVGESALSFTITLGRQTSGSVWLRLPNPSHRAACDGQPVSISPAAGTDIYELELEVDQQAEVIVEL